MPSPKRYTFVFKESLSSKVFCSSSRSMDGFFKFFELNTHCQVLQPQYIIGSQISVKRLIATMPHQFQWVWWLLAGQGLPAPHQILSVRSLYPAFLGLNQTRAKFNVKYRLEKRMEDGLLHNFGKIWARQFRKKKKTFSHPNPNSRDFLALPPSSKRDWFSPATASSLEQKAQLSVGKGKQYRVPSNQSLN